MCALGRNWLHNSLRLTPIRTWRQISSCPVGKEEEAFLSSQEDKVQLLGRGHDKTFFFLFGVI